MPNETLITQRVENSSLADPRVLRADDVQVAYGTDVRALQPKLVAAMRARAARDRRSGAERAAQQLRRRRHGPDDRFWIRDPENGQGNVRSEVNLAVLAVLNARRRRDPVSAARRPRGGLDGAERPRTAVAGSGGGALTASARPANRRRLHVMRTIETAALTLEPQPLAHADEMFEVLSDPAIYEYENQAPASLDALRRRYAALESRRSPDGAEQWLNWVIRLPHGERSAMCRPPCLRTAGPRSPTSSAAPGGAAAWPGAPSRRWSTSSCVQHGVQRLTAVLKHANLRSRRLLERLGFELASQDEQRRRGVEADELLMERAARTALPAHPPSASDRLRALARRVAAAHVVAGAPPSMRSSPARRSTTSPTYAPTST